MDNPKNGLSTWDLLLRGWVAIACVYIILRPVSHNTILYPVLLSLAFVGGIAFLRSDKQATRAFFLPAVLWIILVVFGVVVAVLRQADSWVRVLAFMAFWPFFFSMVVLGFRRWAIQILFWSAAVVTVVVGLIFVIGALSAAGRLPVDVIPSLFVQSQTLRYTVDAEGVISLSAHALPTLLWWAPMWIASLFIDRTSIYLPPMWLRIIAAGFGVAGALVAWRRAIVLVVLLVPIIMLVAWLVLGYRNENRNRFSFGWWRARLWPFVSFLAIALGVAFFVQSQLLLILGRGANSIAVTLGISNSELDPSELDLQSLTRAELTSQDDQLADVLRRNEWKSLLPTHSVADLLVGRGFGASIERGGVVRDMKPWQTELQYNMIFFWTGIVGVVLIVLILILSVRILRRAFRSDGSLQGVLFVSVVGALAVLIGNATNPYMQAPGHMWPVFFPFMVAAVMLRAAPQRDHDQHESAVAQG